MTVCVRVCDIQMRIQNGKRKKDNTQKEKQAPKNHAKDTGEIFIFATS